MKKKFFLKTKLLVTLLALGSIVTIGKMNRSYAYSSFLCNYLNVFERSSLDIESDIKSKENVSNLVKNSGKKIVEHCTALDTYGGAYCLGDPVEIVIDHIEKLTKKGVINNCLKVNDAVVKLYADIIAKKYNMFVNPSKPYGKNGKHFSIDEIKKAKENPKTHLHVGLVPVDNTVEVNEQYRTLYNNGILDTVLDNIEPVTEKDIDEFEKRMELLCEKGAITEEKLKEFKEKARKAKDQTSPNFELDGKHYFKYYGATRQKNTSEDFCEQIENTIKELIESGKEVKNSANDAVLLTRSFQTNSSEMNHGRFPRLMYNPDDQKNIKFGNSKFSNSELYCKTFIDYWFRMQNEDIKKLAENYEFIERYIPEVYRKVPSTTAGGKFKGENNLMAHPVLHAIEFSSNPNVQKSMLDSHWIDTYSTAVIMAEYTLAIAKGIEKKQLNYSNVVLNTDFVDGKVILNIGVNLDGDYLENLSGVSVVMTNAYDEKKSKEYELKKDENVNSDRAWKIDGVNLNDDLNENIDFKNHKNNKFYLDVNGKFNEKDVNGEFVEEKNKMFSNVSSFEITPDEQTISDRGEWKKQVVDENKPVARINEVTKTSVYDELHPKGEEVKNK